MPIIYINYIKYIYSVTSTLYYFYIKEKIMNATDHFNGGQKPRELEGARLEPVPMDGDCFYHAILYQLRPLGNYRGLNDDEATNLIRPQVAGHIERRINDNPDNYPRGVLFNDGGRPVNR